MNDQLNQFYDWLKEHLATESSANSYLSRLKRAFKIWNNNASYIKPIENNLSLLVDLAHSNPRVFEILIDRILSYLAMEQNAGKIQKNSANDVATAIRAFEKWCINSVPSNVSAQPQIHNLISSISTSSAQSQIYSPNSLNLRARIASRSSKYWPARELGKLIGNTKNDSWITQTLNHVIVLTDHGIHHIKDIDLMKVDTNNYLWVHPFLYPNTKWAMALGYHANGSIYPLKVMRDNYGFPKFSSITLEHSPAISIITKSGMFPEFSKLIAKQPNINIAKLKKEFAEINHVSTYMLMERAENSKKSNNW